jgi:hypothetical protein
MFAMVISRRIELPNMVAVQRPHDANPGEHRGAAAAIELGCSKINFSRRGDAADNPWALPRARNMD